MYQKDLYNRMVSFNLTDKCVGSCDYFKVGKVNGILYYSPNDESWGAIIAVDHKNKLAINTGFYEMDDMEYIDSDYAQVCHNGKLMCIFETKDK